VNKSNHLFSEKIVTNERRANQKLQLAASDTSSSCNNREIETDGIVKSPIYFVAGLTGGAADGYRFSWN